MSSLISNLPSLSRTFNFARLWSARSASFLFTNRMMTFFLFLRRWQAWISLSVTFLQPISFRMPTHVPSKFSCSIDSGITCNSTASLRLYWRDLTWLLYSFSTCSTLHRNEEMYFTRLSLLCFFKYSVSAVWNSSSLPVDNSSAILRV